MVSPAINEPTAGNGGGQPIGSRPEKTIAIGRHGAEAGRVASEDKVGKEGDLRVFGGKNNLRTDYNEDDILPRMT